MREFACRTSHERLWLCSRFVYGDQAILAIRERKQFWSLAANSDRGKDHADQETERTPALHPRTPPGRGRAAVLRRNEGGARIALQVGHPPPDHGARGARLHPASCEPRARHRGFAPPRIGDRLAGAGAKIQPERHSRQPRQSADRSVVSGLGRLPARHGPADGPDRGRHADLGDPDANADAGLARGVPWEPASISRSKSAAIR